ncbi:carbohydrate ABC transporter permease [Enterocloster citroniae]|uniref:carbohydrate ABC transporter permease n=1 Tax=Enterocloster citroniae TaxID=358743 RepID=UPI00306A3166|nr:sugar ABC transporter permease [Enterocloster citroniae]
MQAKTSIQPKRSRRFNSVQGPAFITPTLAVLLFIITYPLLYGVYISLFNTNLVNKWQFVGGKYYASILQNKEFYESVWITLKYTIFVVAGHFVLGMILATIINKPFPGRLLFRTILLLPWVMPDVSIALIFKWIFNPVYGIANQILQDIGLIHAPIEWFSVGTTAFISVVVISIWKGYPLIMLLILAGLQSISENLTEAAKIDGASTWQIQRYIVLPGLKPVMLSALILDTVWWFKHFTIVWITTNGGPDGATNLLSISIFKEAFDNLRFGKAAALAVLVFFICYVIGVVYRKVLDNET